MDAIGNREVTLDNSVILLELMKDPMLNEDQINKVLMRDPNVNLQNSLGQTALMLGATRIAQDGTSELADKEIIQTILKNTDLTLTDNNGNTILHYFILFGVQKKLEFLLDKCNFLAENINKEVALHHVHDRSVMKQLLEKYKNLEAWPIHDKSELLTNAEDYFKNPDKNSSKKLVIELFCQPSFNYPVPRDITTIISLAIKESPSDSLESLDVLKHILKFGSENLNKDHIKAVIKKGNKTIFDFTINNCRNLKNIVCTTDVLLECIKTKINGGIFFDALKGHLTDDSKLNEIKDNVGANIAHCICKFENRSIFQKISMNKKICSQLFKSSDNKDCYPVAHLKNKTDIQFLEALYELYASSKVIFDSITFAKPLVDLVHYAIDNKKSTLASNLLQVGFALQMDPNNRSLLHTIVRSSFKETTIIEKILSQLNVVNSCSLSDFICQVDNFGFSAIDYSLLYEKKEQFDFLVGKDDTYVNDPNKSIHYLVFEKGRSNSDMYHFLDKLGLDYPEIKDPEFTREDFIKIKKAVSVSKTDPQPNPINIELKRIIYNIFIVHNGKSTPDPELSCKLSQEDRIVFCHSIPLSQFTFEHVHFFNKLLNRRLLCLDDLDMTPILLETLEKVLAVSTDHVIVSANIDECLAKCQVLVHRSDLDDESHLSEPSAELLNRDQSVGVIEEQYKPEIESHAELTGFFFACQNVFSRQLYGHFPQASDVEMQELFSKLSIMDTFFSVDGSIRFHNKTQSILSPNKNGSSIIDLKFIHNDFNVSRFSVPMLCSELISRYLLVPSENNKLLLFTIPEVYLAFENASEDEDDFIRVVVEGIDDHQMVAEVRRFIFSLLKKVGKHLKNKLDVEMLHRRNECFLRISEGDNLDQEICLNGVGGSDIELADVQMLAKVDPITGSSPLLCCHLQSLTAALLKAAPDKPIHRYFPSLDPECGMLQVARPTQLIHRLVSMKGGGYTVRQFVSEGNWAAEQRKTICVSLGIDVSETYSKLQNCWRLNWADLLVLGAGILICVTVLIVCELVGVDLETYGVAGIASLPFVLAFLNRIRMSYSHSPQYANLPALNPGG